MLLSGAFVDIGPLAGNGDSLAVMPLSGRHESDAAMAVLVVVPVHECHHLAAERYRRRSSEGTVNLRWLVRCIAVLDNDSTLTHHQVVNGLHVRNKLISIPSNII